MPRAGTHALGGDTIVGMNARAALLSLLAACALPRVADAQGPVVPYGGVALEQWLAAGHYRQWRSEGAPHPSEGPHFGRVRAYLNPVLYASLEAGAKRHPAGAVAVKELYGDGDAVKGWAVYIKIDSADVAESWYWYEKFESRVVADARGVLLCRSCHFTGRDYVLTPWPLK